MMRLDHFESLFITPPGSIARFVWRDHVGWLTAWRFVLSRIAITRREIT